jgi:2-haloacid dehalogenase
VTAAKRDDAHPSDVREIDAVVFDLGGVLIDWNPRHLYRKLFRADERRMEWFLSEICSPAWNAEQDAGRSWHDAVETLSRQHPEHRDLIAAYDARWPEMLGGAIEGTVGILDELHGAGVRLAALSNWSAEKFPVALDRYDFLGWFETIVVSGEVGVAKPDRRIFRHLLDRTGFVPATSLFVDDVAANLAVADQLGFRTYLFRDPPALRSELEGLGLLAEARAV